MSLNYDAVSEQNKVGIALLFRDKNGVWGLHQSIKYKWGIESFYWNNTCKWINHMLCNSVKELS